jgi:hypothetical protein
MRGSSTIYKCSDVKITHSTISTEEYNQPLDEMAEIVYRHICQLSENQPVVSETFSERTGTYV